jgi:hypothetical protein
LEAGLIGNAGPAYAERHDRASNPPYELDVVKVTTCDDIVAGGGAAYAGIGAGINGPTGIHSGIIN